MSAWSGQFALISCVHFSICSMAMVWSGGFWEVCFLRFHQSRALRVMCRGCAVSSWVTLGRVIKGWCQELTGMWTPQGKGQGESEGDQPWDGLRLITVTASQALWQKKQHCVLQGVSLVHEGVLHPLCWHPRQELGMKNLVGSNTKRFWAPYCHPIVGSFHTMYWNNHKGRDSLIGGNGELSTLQDQAM